MGTYLRLAAVTGARRGELCGLRWSDLDADEGQLLIERAVVQGRNGDVVKRTKTNRDRRIALDAGTLASLARQRGRADERATLCGAALAPTAFMSSRDVEDLVPWLPTRGPPVGSRAPTYQPTEPPTSTVPPDN